MSSKPLEGYFDSGTLLVSHYQLRINERPLRNTYSAPISPHEWCAICVVPDSAESGNLPAGSIPLGSIDARILRAIDQGWNESIRVTNQAVVPRKISVQIQIGCPIGDVEYEEEMKSEDKAIHSGIIPEVVQIEGYLKLRYFRDFGRRRHAPTEEMERLMGRLSPRNGEPVTRALDVELRTTHAPSIVPSLRVERSRISELRIDLILPAKERIDLHLSFLPEIDGSKFGSLSIPRTKPMPRLPTSQTLKQTEIITSNSTLNLALGQSQLDLQSLSLPIQVNHGETYSHRFSAFNAGIPRYIGIFGRDNLTSAWQSAIFSPEAMDPVLSRLALYKGVKWDPWRDEEPNRLPHERRLNPKAALGDNNREIYYGDSVSTLFWIVTLAAAYHWTADARLLDRHFLDLQTFCHWIERKLEQGSGYIYYNPESSENSRNHAWKDSGDAIVDSVGRIQVPPLATAEIQGYCYLALLAAAELMVTRRKFLLARRYFTMATNLKKRFNRHFWMPEQNYFAIALTPDGRQVDSITSNIGHCLGCGIISAEKVPAVVGKLISPEMFSGWGIRTLSSDNPAYDPLSYHRGSVWPVENASIAAAFRLWGYDEQARMITTSQLAAAGLFDRLRLPEAMSGHPRTDDYPVPGLYPYTNLLQSWSVSAIPFYIQVILGLRPFAPLGAILLKPDLPEWLEWIEVRRLRVGRNVLSLRCWRNEKGGTRWKILENELDYVILEQPTFKDQKASFWSRLKGAARSAA